MMYGMENTQSFERIIIMMAEAMLDESGQKHAPFGRAVFGESNGARLWRMTRGDLKERRLSVNEAKSMADYFEMDFPTFIWKAHQWGRDKGLIS